MMKAAPLLLFLIMSVAGCVGTEGADGLAPALPRVGDTFHYQGSDGSYLNVSMVGPVSWQDPWLDTVDAWATEWTYDTGRHAGEEVYTFREYLDSNGRIVGQWADCAVLVADNLQGPFRCAYFQEFIYGGYGLPGGFGAALAWNGTLEPGTSVVDRHWVLDAGPMEMEYHVEAEAGCVRLEPASEPTDLPRMLPWTTVSTAVTMCPDTPIPTKFTTAELPKFAPPESGPAEYTLVSWTRGSGMALEEAALDVARTAAPQADWRSADSEPYSGLEPNASVLTVAEAHAQAKEQHEGYRDAVEAGGVLAGYYHFVSGGGTLVSGETQTRREAEATLDVVRPDGEALRVVVREVQTETLGVPQSTYTVSGGQGSSVAVVPRVQPQVGFEVVDDFGEALHGYEVADVVFFTHARGMRNSWSVDDGARDSYSLWNTYEDPEQAGNTVQWRLNLVVDGRSGGIIAAHTSR